MNVSIADVAKKADVSVATVSRVLNGHASVKPGLARRVREAMEAIGYEPRPVRPGPKPKSTAARTGTGTLGVVLHGHTEALLQFPYMNRMFMAITSEAQRHHYQPTVITLQDEQQVLPRIIREGQVDGLILLGGAPISEHGAADFYHPLPCVQVGGVPVALPVLDHVLVNNRAAGMIAADYLVSRKCKRPAFLNHAPQHQAFPPRWAAFRERLERQGLMAERYVSEDDGGKETWSPPAVRAMLRELLDRLLADKPDTDGIFLPVDHQSAVCHALLKERGIAPEKDITLVSCNNDEPWLLTMEPRPATVDLRPDEQGRHAVRRLIQRLDDPLPGPVVSLVTPRLIAPANESGVA